MEIKRGMSRAQVICSAIILTVAACACHRDTRNAEAPDQAAKLVWYAAAQFGVEGKGWSQTESAYDRLPRKARGIVREPVWDLGRMTAGLLVRFTTDAGKLHVRWTLTEEDLAMKHMPATGVSGLDLYARDSSGKLRFCANGRPKALTNQVAFDLPPSSEYVLYLPLYNGLERLKLGIARHKTLSRRRGPKRQLVFYGTSITQGACASRPGMAAPALVGRALEVSVINLGFSGHGQMEIEMADLLSELDPAAYVLDCLWNMTPEMVAARVAPFIRRIRAVRPATPIILVEDSNLRGQSTPKGEILRREYERLYRQGDRNLYFLPNKGMLGADGEGTVDGGHPNDLGMARQAAVFIAHLAPLLAQPEIRRSK